MQATTNEDMNANSLQRGSIWHKWDLHIHSPMSALNNQFPKLSDGLPNWSAYISTLKSLKDTPGSLYQPSSTVFPRTIIEYVYPKGFITRRVNNSGDISWHKDRVFISEVFRFEDLGFELVAEEFYKVFFREVEIGEFDVEARRFRPVQAPR